MQWGERGEMPASPRLRLHVRQGDLCKGKCFQDACARGPLRRSVAGRRGVGDQNRSRPESPALGSGAHALLDELFSAYPGALGQKAGTLSGLSPFCLCPHRLPCCRVIRIDSK